MNKLDTYVLAKIVFALSDSVLITERLLKPSFILICFSLLGTVIGFMEIVGNLMNNTEAAFTSLNSKLEKIETNKNIKKNMLLLKHNFRIISKRLQPITQMTFRSSSISHTDKHKVEQLDETRNIFD